jgi:5-methylcytosine-specific restriction protein A
MGGRPWRRLRSAILDTEPLCRPCSAMGRVTVATEVDHVLPRSEGGTDDQANLQPICHPCHVAKTVARTGG